VLAGLEGLVHVLALDLIDRTCPLNQAVGTTLRGPTPSQPTKTVARRKVLPGASCAGQVQWAITLHRDVARFPRVSIGAVKELAVDHEACADTRAERYEGHVFETHSGAVPRFGPRCRRGVVLGNDRDTELCLHTRDQRIVENTRDVGCIPKDSVGIHQRGHTKADGVDRFADVFSQQTGDLADRLHENVAVGSGAASTDRKRFRLSWPKSHSPHVGTTNVKADDEH
jgi:hypothetical protein